MQIDTATMEDSMEILWGKKKKKLGIKLPYDPAIPLLGISLMKPKLKKTHTPQCSLQQTIYNN